MACAGGGDIGYRKEEFDPGERSVAAEEDLDASAKDAALTFKPERACLPEMAVLPETESKLMRKELAGEKELLIEDAEQADSGLPLTDPPPPPLFIPLGESGEGERAKG